MCAHAHTSMHECAHTQVQMCAHTRPCTYMHTHIHMHAHAHTHTHASGQAITLIKMAQESNNYNSRLAGTANTSTFSTSCKFAGCNND